VEDECGVTRELFPMSGGGFFLHAHGTGFGWVIHDPRCCQRQFLLRSGWTPTHGSHSLNGRDPPSIPVNTCLSKLGLIVFMESYLDQHTYYSLTLASMWLLAQSRR
jgi:hypothetical protein